MYAWIERGVSVFGMSGFSVLAGLAIGILFGFMAQRSRFCLRSAVVEFATANFGEKLAIWLFTFGTAITLTQIFIGSGTVDVSSSRALAAPGSISGALVGGLCFGIGMILARGCASRMLILSATGNLRALLTGLIFVVVAQAAFMGILSPLRLWINGLWMVDGGPTRDLMLLVGGKQADKVPVALVWFAAALLFAIRGRISIWGWIGGIGAGLAVALAYLVTTQIGVAAMETGTARGITFSGPSAELLMRILGGQERAPGFDAGLMPGVFLGAAFAAVLFREWKIQIFDANSGMLRYMFGGALMGFGAMLAGGCAVGAGVSGGAIFSLTAWLALVGMWAGAAAMHYALDEKRTDARAALKSGRLVKPGRLISGRAMSGAARP